MSLITFVQLVTVPIRSFGWAGCVVGERGLIQSVLFCDTQQDALNALYRLTTNIIDRAEDADSGVFEYWSAAFSGFFEHGPSARQPGTIPLDDRLWTGFQKQVYQMLRQMVKWGETISYGELAKRAGYPGAARAVGTAMAKNRCAPFIPCHRVICADGNAGNYSGRNGTGLKKKLLYLESALRGDMT